MAATVMGEVEGRQQGGLEAEMEGAALLRHERGASAARTGSLAGDTAAGLPAPASASASASAASRPVAGAAASGAGAHGQDGGTAGDAGELAVGEDEEDVIVYVGRMAVVLLGAISVAWLPVIPLLGQQLFVYVQLPPAFFAGPVVVLYLGGAVMGEQLANDWGAVACIVVGWALGAVRFVGELGGWADSLGWFGRMHYLHFAAVSAVLSLAVLLAGTAVSVVAGCNAKTTGHERYIPFDCGLRHKVLQQQLREAGPGHGGGGETKCPYTIGAEDGSIGGNKMAWVVAAVVGAGLLGMIAVLS